MADVYRHRGRRLWSVREGGRVVGHREAVCLVDVVLVASEAGRLRCLRGGQREVVAWARGELADRPRPAGARRLRYRIAEAGFRVEGAIVTRASAAWFEADGSAWCEGESEMRVWILSDLHVDASPWVPPPGPLVDLAIVAGDVADGLTRRSLPWLAEHVVSRAREVVYVPGNHDIWRTRYPDEILRARDAAIAADITLLDAGQARHVDGIEVIGASLWTDYAIGGAGQQALAMRVAGDRHVGMRDHRLIQTRDRLGTPAAFRPPAALALHAEHRARIERQLAEPWPGPRIVVTHHAPHPRSLLHGEVREPIDAAYASDLSAILEGEHAPDLWIHGHVHASRDYLVGRTRVIANPRGHDTSHRRRDGTWIVELENPSFDPALVLGI